jgi:hypothetical protein
VTPSNLDRAVRVTVALLLAAFLVAIVASEAHASGRWQTEPRAEYALVDPKHNSIGLESVLCMGVGRYRGDPSGRRTWTRRYNRFICSALVYPDTHIMLRVRFLSTGDYVVA